LLDAANMIAYLFSVLLIPVFSRMIKRKESVEKMVKLSFTLADHNSRHCGIRLHLLQQ
jgi:hypothetical protein